ncbi:MAG: hypothetical protein ACRD50_07015 [Candidatus Acidiferrales bacterium]
MKRAWLFALVLALCATPSGFCQNVKASPPAAAPVAGDDPREIIRRAAENDFANELKTHEYTYVERDETRRLNSKGGTKSTESKTYDVLFLAGEQTQRLTAKNDKPLPAKEAAKEDERLEKIIRKREQESPEKKQKRLAEEEKERAESRKFVLEIAEAYNFTMEQPETLNGRETYVIAAEPRPGFQPHMKYANYLPKFRFHIWIDKAELQWVKLHVDVLDTVSWGLFLLRLHKGSQIELEQTRVNDEVWLPEHVHARLDARVGLLMQFNIEVDQTYRDYREFQSGVRILSSAPAPKP